jgi:hypothetical protein
MLRNDDDDVIPLAGGSGGASVMTTLLSVTSSLGAAPLLGRLDRGNAAMTRCGAGLSG